MMEVSLHKIIIVISGKRKSGKDFVADKVCNKLGENNCIQMKVANPIKMHFSKKYGLNFEELLTSSLYKERVRKEMILWGNEQRVADPYIFCKIIKKDAINSKKKVWILTDARLQTDIEYFREYAKKMDFTFICLRVVADTQTRQQRGWTYVEGVDDVPSECGLDEYNQWDFIFSNSNDDNVEKDIDNLCIKVKNLFQKLMIKSQSKGAMLHFSNTCDKNTDLVKQ